MYENHSPRTSDEAPTTLVCSGFTVGSTTSVIWVDLSGISSEETKKLVKDQLKYDRWIEISASSKNDGMMTITLPNEDNLAYPTAWPYRERRQINWVYTDLGWNKDVIKIIAKNDINPGVIGEIKFTFKASDNLPQAYVGSLNVFNAFYTRRYDSGSVVMLQGNSVGMKLAIGQIKGIAFLDNDRNGLYDIVTDTLLKDVEIKLWDKDKGIEVATTKTNSNGEYKFEGLPAGNYEIRVKNDGNPINANATDAKRFTKQTIVSGDSYKYDSDILSTNDIDGSITVSIPNNSMTPDINDYINVGFIEPINVNIITDGNGTVSGGHSLAYKAWQLLQYKSQEL